MKWYEDLARQLGTKHSDAIAVVRAGRNAKRRSRRRERANAKKQLRSV